MCNNPSTPFPNSTNAPYFSMFLTVPSKVCPTSKLATNASLAVLTLIAVATFSETINLQYVL